ncbi:hypothetical protein AM501_09810 [Aneurinibacillus migulanus]|uniref:hypothetical protein n=1 Tax=Aneurinibacillus migulanus TaxID=47500 RepID=UPI0005BB7296|nr:hypothetical protein [Aneurinibacillus migulanus]KIV56440.1 hypothetical protein TS64_09225 [Aneurinibacillus migulanus]KPD08448.1 hypothetical protein AM501_09810 [Aneurinibacillus migulanus]CEH29081.1 Uncharacterized protein BN1090_A2_01507 [Aneurinibacillus migulanus]
MIESITKPIIIGNFVNGGGDMGWAWWHVEHCRLAIIGDKDISPREKMVEEIARLVHARDENAVFWITGGEPPKNGEIHEVDAIDWVESYPDPPEEFEDRNLFILDRNFFSAAYLLLLAMIKGVERKDLLPPASFRSHMEGPFKGYKRALEQLEDGEHKDWLRREFKLVEAVEWYKVPGQGMKYHIGTGTVAERAASFLRAAWSFWALVAKQDKPQQFLLIVEPPKDFLVAGADKDIQRFMVRVLQILNSLTISTTTSIVLASDVLFPIPQQNYRFKIFFQTKNSDINLWDPTIQQILKLPELYTAWEQGNHCVGMWEDHLLQERIVTEFKTSGMEFMDEFEENNDEGEALSEEKEHE